MKGEGKPPAAEVPTPDFRDRRGSSTKRFTSPDIDQWREMQGDQSNLRAIEKWPAKKAINIHRQIFFFSGGGGEGAPNFLTWIW
jgi:hypothetical protein